MEVAYATAKTAVERKESRGAHSREDFPKRDDENFLQHTFSSNSTFDFISVSKNLNNLYF